MRDAIWTVVRHAFPFLVLAAMGSACGGGARGAPEAEHVGSAALEWNGGGKHGIDFAATLVTNDDVNPTKLVTADFDHDGLDDVVQLSFPGGLSLVLGTSDGRFQAPVVIPTSVPVKDIVVGDFNDDGKPDIAATDGISHVIVLINQGGGAFSEADFAAGAGPIALAAGDLDHDGELDLAVADNSEISVLFGNGNGTFQLPVAFGQGLSPISIAVGSFKDKHRLDLAVVSGEDVDLLFNDGHGHFGQPQPFFAGSGAESIAVGNFTGHKVDDVVVTNPPIGIITLLRNDGDGNLGVKVPTAFPAGRTPKRMTVGDFNHDGSDDLAVTDNAFPSSDNAFPFSTGVGVFLSNDADGGFAPMVTYPGGPAPFGVAAGHFNADENVDLVNANGSVDGLPSSLRVIPGNGDGTFQSPTYPAGSGPFPLAAGDLNGDGVPDIAVADFNATTVDLLFSNRKGQLGPPTVLTFDDFPNAVAVADFDGDGKNDLLVTFPGSVRILPGNGDGTFGSTIFLPGFSSGGAFVVVADFNGDGMPDLAITTAGVTVLINEGGFTFSVRSVIPVPAISLVAGRFDRDHDHVDLAILEGSLFFQSTGVASVWLGDGKGGFAESAMVAVTPLSAWIATGDFDGDGTDDLVVADAPNGTADVALSNGHGGFGDVVPYASGLGTGFVAVADFDGDGTLDLAVSDGFFPSFIDQVSVLPGKGDGTFPTALTFGTGHGPLGSVVTDLNLDGRPDLVVGNFFEFGGTDVSVLLNTSR